MLKFNDNACRVRLEFDAVFLPGWEEGLFPHQKSLEKGDFALEEEKVSLRRNYESKKEVFLSLNEKSISW